MRLFNKKNLISSLFNNSFPFVIMRILLGILHSLLPFGILMLYKDLLLSLTEFNISSVICTLILYSFLSIFSKIIKAYNIIISEKHNFQIQMNIEKKFFEKINSLNNYNYENIYIDIEKIRIGIDSILNILYNVSNFLSSIIILITYSFVLVDIQYLALILVLIEISIEPLFKIVIDKIKENKTLELVEQNKYLYILERELLYDSDKIMVLFNHNKYSEHIDKYLKIYKKIEKEKSFLYKITNFSKIIIYFIEIILVGMILFIFVRNFQNEELLININIVFLILPQIKANFTNLCNTISSRILKIKYIKFLKDFIYSDLSVDHKQIVENKITFHDVKYSYPNNEKFELCVANCEIDLNKKYILVGKNGIGKSTFAKLLTGLVFENSGTVKIDNKKRLKNNSFPSENFSFYLQEHNKYFETIGYNISFSDDMDINELDKLFFNNEYIEKVKKYSKQLKTPISKTFDEDGIWPSGGEWTQILFARCVYRDKSFYIFDEPQAPLDILKEKQMYEKIREMDNGCLFISHNYSYLNYFDELIFINSKNEVIFGKHKELYETNREYKELYDERKK